MVTTVKSKDVDVDLEAGRQAVVDHGVDHMAVIFYKYGVNLRKINSIWERGLPVMYRYWRSSIRKVVEEKIDMCS